MAGGGKLRSLLEIKKVPLDVGTQGYYREPRGPRTVEVLVNPSQTEVERWAGREVKDLRMMIDKDGNSYVWDGYESIHMPIVEGLGLPMNSTVDELADVPVHPKNYSYHLAEHAENVATYNHMEDYAPPKVEVDPEIEFNENIPRDAVDQETDWKHGGHLNMAGGGKLRGAGRAGKKNLKSGPGLYEDAMEAARQGDSETALGLLKKLQDLLQLTDEDFSQMMGQGLERGQGKFVPPPEPDLDRPIGGYKEQRAPGSKMRKAGGGKIKGGLLQAQEMFAKRAGKVKNPDVDIPEGFDSFYTRTRDNGGAEVYGLRPDGTESKIHTFMAMDPEGGVSAEDLAKEISSIYNTGGFSNTPVQTVSISELFPEAPPARPKAEVIDIAGGGTMWPDPDRAGLEINLDYKGNRLRSFQEHLRNLMMMGDPDEFELADLATIAEDALEPLEYEDLMDDIYDAGLTPKFYREFAENVPKEPFFEADVTMHGGPIKMAEILEGLGISPDELGDEGVRQRLMEMLGEAEGLSETAEFDPSGKTLRDVQSGELSTGVDMRRLSSDELHTLNGAGIIDDRLLDELDNHIVDLESEFQDIIMDMEGEWPDTLELVPSIYEPETYTMKATFLDSDRIKIFDFDPERGPRESIVTPEEFKTYREHIMPDPPDKPEGFYEGGRVKYAEGGDIDDEEGMTAKQFMRNVGQSLFGAVPFTGETDFPNIGADVGEQMYKKGAYPLAGLVSQWWGVNPTTDEFEYAGPGADAIHGRGRPAYPPDELLMIDPETHHEMYLAWRDWEDPGETGAIPGIIDETALLPAMPQMIEMMSDMDEMEADPEGYEPFIGAPEFSLTASDRAAENWDRSLEKFGLEEPSGFVENALMSGGMMVGQVPVPAAWANRLRLLLPVKSARVDRVLTQLGKKAGLEAAEHPGILAAALQSGPEFLFPTIEPRAANYIAGALFGGTLMTALDPGEAEELGLSVDVQELINIMQAEGEGSEEARKVLMAIYEASEQKRQIQEELDAEKLERLDRGLTPSVQQGEWSDIPDWDPEDAQFNPENMAGGGKISKVTRRGFLKGALGAGAGALGLGKAAVHGGASEIDQLKRIEEALEVPAAAVKTAIPSRTSGVPFRKVVAQLKEEFDKHWTGDPEMAEMYEGDMADYNRVADAMDEGRYEDAVDAYDNMDTAARESIYDLEDDDVIFAKRELGKAGSDYDSLEWEDLDIGEQEIIIDELKDAYETGGQKSYEEVADALRDKFGVSVDVVELEHHIFEGGPNDFAGGGKIRKGITRRDVLKGGAAGATAAVAGALGMGKAAVKTGALEAGAAAPVIKEALSKGASQIYPTAAYSLDQIPKKSKEAVMEWLDLYLENWEQLDPETQSDYQGRRTIDNIDYIREEMGMAEPFDDMVMHHDSVLDLEDILEMARDDAIDTPQHALLDDALQSIRGAKALEPNELFTKMQQSAFDRPTAFDDYQMRMEIPESEWIELPMRGDLEDVLTPKQLEKIADLFDSGEIPEALLSGHWDT